MKFNWPNWLRSSTGQGMARRWKAFFAMVLPVLLFLFPGIEWQELDSVIERVILILYEIVSIIFFLDGWVRRNLNRRASLGKFARKPYDPIL